MKLRTLLSLFAILVAASLCYAAPVIQPPSARGAVHGIVTDPSGAVIPGATVIVSANHLVKTASTDESGQFEITGLPAGHYLVQIHSAGFSTFEKSGLVVAAGYQTEADAQLTISASKQEITVSD